MKEATFIGHLGTGDLICTCAIAEYLTQEKGYDKVYFPCSPFNENSVKSFFLLSPKVEVYKVNDVDGILALGNYKYVSNFTPRGWIFKTGFYSDEPYDRNITFSEAYYKQLGIDYSVRFDYCPIQKVCNTFYDVNLLTSTYYSLIHEDYQRGFNIKDKHLSSSLDRKYILPSNSSILAFYPIIKYASRIDAVDSFLIHLIDSLELNSDLYYHEYSRPMRDRWNDKPYISKHKWNTIK